VYAKTAIVSLRNLITPIEVAIIILYSPSTQYCFQKCVVIDSFCSNFLQNTKDAFENRVILSDLKGCSQARTSFKNQYMISNYSTIKKMVEMRPKTLN